MNGALRWFGGRLARFLARPSRRAPHPPTCTPEQLDLTLHKGDVLLVEGNSRFSAAIQYLTQSTWSHSALCVEDAAPGGALEAPRLLEADINEGVRLVPVSFYGASHTRICRPVGLAPEELETVAAHARERLGQRYDLKNVFDLARWLIQRPPVPDAWKRRLLRFGSGDPTRAICSSLIAQAFRSIGYPILPERLPGWDVGVTAREARLIREHNLFTPRDFDVSPYFEVVKPTLAGGFAPKRFARGEDSDGR